GKTQPSVSRSLSELEKRLGVSLFESKKRPLRPTEFCVQLAQFGRTITEAGTSASEFVVRFKRGQAGALRVAGSPIFMDGVVSPVLAAFQSEYPSIAIDQSYGYVQKVLEGITSDKLDLGILPIRSSQVPASVDALPLLPGRNVIACRMGHPLARHPNLDASAVADQAWIAPPPESPLYHDLRAVLDRIGMKNVKVSFSGGSLASILNFLQESDALTVLPYSVVYRLRRQNTLMALPLQLGDPDRHLCALVSKVSPDFPARNRLLQYLTNEMASLEDLMGMHEAK
ncbi:MAG: LysR family transcriptional regulator, partial [Pseudomonadota bacterium]